jgi:hypothetical protein
VVCGSVPAPHQTQKELPTHGEMRSHVAPVWRADAPLHSRPTVVGAYQCEEALQPGAHIRVIRAAALGGGGGGGGS